MVTLMFLLMGAVFAALAGSSYERGAVFPMIMSTALSIYCFSYYIAVVGTLP